MIWSAKNNNTSPSNLTHNAELYHLVDFLSYD